MTDRQWLYFFLSLLVIVVAGTCIGIQNDWWLNSAPKAAPAVAQMPWRDKAQILISKIPAVGCSLNDLMEWKSFVSYIYSEEATKGASPGQAAIIDAAKAKAARMLGTMEIWNEKQLNNSPAENAVLRLELLREKTELETLITRSF